jgi:hypothetical protein
MHPERWKRPATADATSSDSSHINNVHPHSIHPSAFAQRRRSTALHPPPPAPPPSEPIPSLPIPEQQDPTAQDGIPSIHHPSDDIFYAHPPRTPSRPTLNPYARSAGSANLAAVAAFSEARYASSSRPNGSTSPEPISDLPPRYAATRSPPQDHDHVPDRSLLSPPITRATPESRPSSRRALTRALELAREAVRLDSNNDDPHAAVLAYGRSVALLSEVMERVRRGEDSPESHRRHSGRRRSVVAQEEEVRRLKTIVSSPLRCCPPQSYPVGLTGP